MDRAGASRPSGSLLTTAGAAVVVVASAVAFAASRHPQGTLVAVVLLTLTGLAAYRPPVAVAILVASFYFDSYLAVGLGLLTIGKLVGVLTGGAWFFSWAVARRPVVVDSLFWVLGGLTAWIALALAAAYDSLAGMAVASRYLTFFLLVFLVVQTVNSDRRQAARLVDVAVAAAAVSAVLGLLNFFVLHADRAGGPLADPNDFGFLLAVTVPLAMLAARRAARPVRQALAVLALTLIAAAILVSFSRGALIGLAAAGTWAVATRRLAVRWGVIAATGVLAVALVIYHWEPQLVESGLERKQHVASSNVDARLVAWSVAGQEFASSPLLGVGPGNFESRFDEFGLPVETGQGPITTHNAYLNVLAELGAPGLALFVAYLAMSWARLRRRAPGDPDGDALQSALAAGFLIAMVGSFFLTEQFYSPLWLLPALGATLLRAPANAGTHR